MTFQVGEVAAQEALSELKTSAASPAVALDEKRPRQAVSTRFVDFWLLGGASIVLWFVMQLGALFRDQSEAIESRFMQVGALFAMMSIFCNHPHFMISYRFGYGRGIKFVKRHWFALVAVPLGLIAAYVLAYFQFNYEISDSRFRLGSLDSLGVVILSLSVLLMNLTVGWHYSKQVFGCIMVYAHYDRYPMSRIQRELIKASLSSVAALNFFTLFVYSGDYSSHPLGKSYFFGVPVIPLKLPPVLIPLTAIITGILAVATLVCVFYWNYRRHKRLPSPNLVVPWVAFFFWWVPFHRQLEYYFATIPFFHSLQYLPFAYRLEEARFKKSRWPEVRRSIFLAVLLFVGFCAFELVPSLLDSAFETAWYLRILFFTVSFAVFINVHHFFIDSVIWKFNQKEIREGLLE